jgi:hypothetical protein
MGLCGPRGAHTCRWCFRARRLRRCLSAYLRHIAWSKRSSTDADYASLSASTIAPPDSGNFLIPMNGLRC